MTHELNEDQRSLPVMRRFASLDIFRGAIIAAMVVVNNPGDPIHVYSQLAHAPWHGMTITDVRLLTKSGGRSGTWVRPD